MWIFCLLVSILCGDIVHEHDYHVSRTEIQYNADTRRIEFRIQIFADDLEIALEDRGYPDLRLATDSENPIADSLVNLYLEDRIRLVLSGRDLDFRIMDKSSTDDYMGVWYYLETEPCELQGELRIRIDVLTEVFRDQVNLVSSVLRGGEVEYLLLNRSVPEKSMTFE